MYIQTLQSEDPRIKIINNKKNMGILYSRSIGALSSKGKYIFPLDNDDMFLDRDVFSIISNIADEGNYDIVEFKGIFGFNSNKGILERNIYDTAFGDHILNLKLKQPELGRFPIIPGKELTQISLVSIFIWAKCIKTKIYRKALKKYGKSRYSHFMIRHEDIVASVFLFNTAESYKFIGKYGLFYIESNDSASKKVNKKWNEIELNIYNIYVTDVLIDFSKNIKENKLVIINFIMNLLNRTDLKETLNLNNFYKKLFISCIDRVLKTRIIPNELKKEIIKKGKQKLNFIDYHF